ncbi:hypothetical protein GRX03_09740 [Halovenus sp. WSH3]|uniref:Uncharacterized protein n=1 Tax=Halovenus carboxidivorans TaxID=2692199 RepID=A0A6B0T1P1_9EURY|nr:hypothetical protein [Halovenus carboxidivorans]MXR51885.1 hypothetical protein [Halovenus carboxidivorans]
MSKMRALGGAAVLLIAVGLGGILASLVTNNQLFIGSTEFSAPAIVTLLVFVGAIVAFIAVGRPWRFWTRTPYW